MVSPVTSIDDAERTPELPWAFEISALSGWVPGPRGIVIDRGGVVWQYDHRHDPWLPEDLGGKEVTGEELGKKFASGKPVHSVDRTLFEKVLRLADRLDSLPLEEHTPHTLDYSPTFQYLDFVAKEGGENGGKYREEVILSSSESRRGEVIELLTEWAELQFGDGALARFPPAKIAEGTLADLGRRIDQALAAK